jgi:REP element-mobilizing transposase RayT
VEYSGACYHVINRGNRRQEIFERKRDCELFIDKLGEFSEVFSVEIFSYCLMGNHFHLYIRTGQPNLSRFMQSLLTSFTIIKNRYDRSSGHLFQGRFKSILVESELYGSQLSRYIHLNPVRTAHVKGLSLEGRRRCLREFKWGSYPEVCGFRRCPEWLVRNETLKRWGPMLGEQERNYAKYVEEGLLRDIGNPMEEMAMQTVLGSDSFVGRIRRGVTHLGDKDNVRRELAEHGRIKSSFAINELIAAVVDSYRIAEDRVLLKNSRDNEPRQVLMYLACRFCRGRYSLTEIADGLNVSLGGLTRSRYNMEKRIRVDKTLGTRIVKFEEKLLQS